MSVTRDNRADGWNVQFLDSRGLPFSGVYQYKQSLTFADVWAELQLCFQFPREAETTLAFLPEPQSATADVPDMIELDQLDPDVKMPQPEPHQRIKLHLVQHDSRKCAHGHDQQLDDSEPQHSATKHKVSEPCIKPINRPQPRVLPRFLRTDDFHEPPGPWMPSRRNQSSSRSPSKRSLSGSPTKDDTNDGSNTGPVPQFISTQEAKQMMSSFRTKCLQTSDRCAVTGMKGSWIPTNPGLGLEACHIVSQKRYYLYPPPPPASGRLADPLTDDIAALTDAWTATWARDNGILLFSHLHKLFDARLFAIHPESHEIRVFMPSDVLLPYHGQKTHFNKDRPPAPAALRHHWDSCVVENMWADVQHIDVIRPVSPLVTRPLPPPADADDASRDRGDPQKRRRHASPDRRPSSTGRTPPRAGAGGGLVDRGCSGSALTPDSMQANDSFSIKTEDEDKPSLLSPGWSRPREKRRRWDEYNDHDEVLQRGRRKKHKVCTSALESDIALESDTALESDIVLETVE